MYYVGRLRPNASPIVTLTSEILFPTLEMHKSASRQQPCGTMDTTFNYFNSKDIKDSEEYILFNDDIRRNFDIKNCFVALEPQSY